VHLKLPNCLLPGGFPNNILRVFFFISRACFLSQLSHSSWFRHSTKLGKKCKLWVLCSATFIILYYFVFLMRRCLLIILSTSNLSLCCTSEWETSYISSWEFSHGDNYVVERDVVYSGKVDLFYGGTWCLHKQGWKQKHQVPQIVAKDLSNYMMSHSRRQFSSGYLLLQHNT
jgi:hypothetical protein